MSSVAFSELPTPPRPSGLHGEEDGPRRPSPLRLLFGTYLPFVLSALWAAVVIRVVSRNPVWFLPLAIVAALWVVPIAIARRRQRTLLTRGNVPEVLEAWAPTLATTPYPDTMQPLLVATAYAANGWTEQARGALRRARRGGAWDAAEEQRLIVEILLDAFDGDRARALRTASTLESMPLPPVGVFLRRRISVLRAGLAALARAFARTPRATDYRLLRAAASSSPMFHWAFSYAASIVAIEDADAAAARRALAGAPPWPQTSVYGDFHAEITQQIERLEAIREACQ